jgi:hypothetical protein
MIVMKTLAFKKIGAFAVLCAVATAALFAADGLDVTFDLSTSLLRVTSFLDMPAGSTKPDVFVDSFATSTFDDSEIKFSYDGETYGGALTLGFEDSATPAFEFDEVYGWIKPFGNVVKFTGGIFDNNDGINLYDDVIDDYDMGIFGFKSRFLDGADGTPEGNTSIFLSNGFLTDLSFGAFTLQLLLGPNLDARQVNAPSSDDPRYLINYGVRFYTPVKGFGTIAAQYKLSQTPFTESSAIVAYAEHTFGIYADITAADNLGLTIGYTGLLPTLDVSGAKNSLVNGIDLRGVFTGISGVAIHTHNNLTFAKGSNKDAVIGDRSVFFLYDAIALDIDLGNGLSLIPEINYKHQEITENNVSGEFFDSYGVKADFKKTVNDHASIKCGLAFGLESGGSLDSNGKKVGDSVTTTAQFSVPVGMTIKW